MATVYLAVDRRLDRDVALKVMHAHLAEGASGSDFVARFRREARTAARLTHPGLVAVYDQGVDGETSYLTMEYIDGSNLRRYLGERGALTVGDALRIGECVLDALATAHRGELVHRDIKPENVLLATDGRVKLADFGLARAVTEVTSTTTGTVLGTVAYLAPELVTAGVSDARTDVYACGILLFEMLTGPPAVHRRDAHPGGVPARQQRRPRALRARATGCRSRSTRWSARSRRATRTTARSTRGPPSRCCVGLAWPSTTRRSRDTPTSRRRSSCPPRPTPTRPTWATGSDADRRRRGDDAAERRQRTDPDQAETTKFDASDARGTTVALPIGLGVTARGARVRWPAPGQEAPPRPLDRPARCAGRADRRRVLVVRAGTDPARTRRSRRSPGRTPAHASQILANAGLEGKPTKDFSTTAPIDEVFATDPGEGSRIRNGGVVAFTVSKGPDLVVMPASVVDTMQDAAEKTLKDAGLTVVYGPPANSDTIVKIGAHHQRAAARRVGRRSRGAGQPGHRRDARRLGRARRGQDHLGRQPHRRRRDEGRRGRRAEDRAHRGVQRHRPGRADHRPVARRRHHGAPHRHDLGERVQGSRARARCRT